MTLRRRRQRDISRLATVQATHPFVLCTSSAVQTLVSSPQVYSFRLRFLASAQRKRNFAAALHACASQHRPG